MLEAEERLICAPDKEFRFHSGPLERRARS
jgi:tRNA isopentenyl-2-thiomethyl-A-37 hydroxylase MiaE